ncbi:MAG: ATP-dependent DNA helicase RecG [Candidatus Eremiobacteraeota bacterium]|nr:ATP-dependent DNA helicase RecG [Candidatus Eremiobacteraeota bacterium]
MDPVSKVPGVSSAAAQQLSGLGIFTVWDLVHHYPYRYDDLRAVSPLSQLGSRLAAEPGSRVEVNVAGTIATVSHVRLRGRVRSKTTARIEDDGAVATAIWFGRSYLGAQLRAGMRLFIRGRLEGTPLSPKIVVSRHHMMSADEDYAGELVPVYPQTAVIKSQIIGRTIRKALATLFKMDAEPSGLDPLPPAVVAKRSLPTTRWALATIHAPPDPQAAARARYRLVFEEFFLLAAAAARRRAARRGEAAPDFAQGLRGFEMAGFLADFAKLLDFSLTAAQRRVIDEISADMLSRSPMNRLLQGDVGCGKTAVATAAILLAVRAGHQGALMAPTEILAVQHFAKLESILSRAGVRSALLVGALKPRTRQRLLDQVRRAEIDVVIGTHALLTDDVEFARLGCVVIDEQHRFGVLQRAMLRAKAKRWTPHTLIMTATPIPRTLAQTLYADLDISIIDELPPGRRPVKTFVRSDADKARIFSFVREEIKRGRQAYVVCPAVEESPTALHSAVQQAEQLTKHEFAGQRVALLHGQMPSRQKDEVMKLFACGFVQILIATSVVEVGVDVPNATIMVVLDAQAFGLAQLHQLRGRVGRGIDKSYCILVGSESSSDVARVDVLAKTNDGFAIAEEDLKARGGGDLVGTRQHGGAEMRLAHIVRDFGVYVEAKREADELVAADPALVRPEHAALVASLAMEDSAAELRLTS